MTPDDPEEDLSDDLFEDDLNLLEELKGMKGMEGVDFDAVKKMLQQSKTLTEDFEELEKNQPEIFKVAQSGDVEEARRLIEAGADLQHRDKNGYTVTILAGCSGDGDMLDLLMEHGAPLDDVSSYGESVLSVLSNRGFYEIIGRVLKKGADPSLLKWSPLHRAIALGGLEEVRVLVDAGESLEDRDSWHRTPFLLALHAGALDKAQLLLDAGADRGVVGHCNKTPMEYAIERDHCDLLDWLIGMGFDIHQKNQFGHTAIEEAVEDGASKCFARLVEAGADWQKRNEFGFGLMNDASHPDIIRQLIDLGANPSELEKEERNKLIGLPACELEVSKEDYHAGRERRFGTANPERMNIPFWDAMVRCGKNAYHATNQFGDSSYDLGTATWCHDRFGMSLTPLPDGRWVEIAGEHEDHYDPDFCHLQRCVRSRWQGQLRDLRLSRRAVPAHRLPQRPCGG